jgi:CubicO group peptidase (beta-lactamase class C family)
MAAGSLLGPVTRAQSAAFTSYEQFNDTLVARFNRNDFQDIESLSSPVLRNSEPAESRSRFWLGWQAKTGRVTSSATLGVRGHHHDFEWKGEKQNLRVTLRSPMPGVLDDYTISDFIAQSTSRPTPILTDNKLKTPLDQAVHRAAALYMQHPDAVGLSIGIYQRGQQRFYNYGEVAKGTNRLPTATTYYDLGSVAKTFIGTLLAQAVLDHKVQLTDDIWQYLPGQYPNLETDGRPIRVVDLANHTSGLGSTSHVYSLARKAQLDKLNLAAKIAIYNQYTADSLLHDLHSLTLATKPGTTYRYTGVDMFVLQVLLERIYQQPYEQLVTHYVQTHFRMQDTKRVLSTQEQQRCAIGYQSPTLPQAHVNYTGYWGGPGMSSTAADLVKYLRANLAEHEPAVRLAHQRTWGTAPAFGLGLAWMLGSDAEGSAHIYHDGKTIGYNTRLVLYPEQDLGIVLLVNENISQDRLTELKKFLTQGLLQPATRAK